MNVHDLIRISAIFSTLFPLGFYLYALFTRKLPRQHHAIAFLLIFFLFLDALADNFYKNKISNVWLFNLGQVVQFCFMFWFYFEVFIRTRHRDIYRKIFLSGIAVFVLCFLSVTVFIQDLFITYQNIVWTTGSIIVIINGMMYFHYLFQTLPLTHLHLKSNLWMQGAILFYFTLTLVLYAMSNFILTMIDPEVSRIIWASHNVINILKNIAIGIGFYYTDRQSTH